MTVTSGDLGAALFRDEYIQDPYPLYAQMLDAGPVHRVGDSDFHAVCGWDAVNEVVMRTGEFSSNLTGTMIYRPDGGIGVFPMDELGGPTQVLAIADDPVHAAHRKVLIPQLAAKRIRALESFVADSTTALCRKILHTGHVEWMSTVANRLPMMVVCRLIGVPEEDSEQLAAWAYASTQLLEGLVSPEELAAAGTAAMNLAGYVAERFDRAAADPHDTLMGHLARVCRTGESDTLTAQMIMVTLFSAGGESTASLIGSAVHIVAARPDVQHRLREDPGLIPAFLEEVLRFEPPFRGHYRHVLDDCSLDGYALSAGSRLLLLWGAANRDPEHFDQPDEFLIDRAKGKAHLAFGTGTHFCVGAALARMEARIVLERLLAHTTRIEVAERGRWLPSLLVRRLDTLTIAVE